MAAGRVKGGRSCLKNVAQLRDTPVPGNTRRETAKARLEEEGFQRQLEAKQKEERLAGLNAAQAGLGRLLSGDTVRSTQQHANEDISRIKEHFSQLRNLANQRENAILMEVSEAHQRVVKQFKARYMVIQQNLHSLQGLEARTPTAAPSPPSLPNPVCPFGLPGSQPALTSTLSPGGARVRARASALLGCRVPPGTSPAAAPAAAPLTYHAGRRALSECAPTAHADRRREPQSA